MKKLTAMVLALSMLLTACGSTAPAEGGEASLKTETLTEAGTYTGEYEGLVINAADTVLEDVTAEKITIAKEVGDGDVTLKNVNVKTLEVYGGGHNSVHVINSAVGEVVSEKQISEEAQAEELQVRIVVEEGTKVDSFNSTNTIIVIKKASEGVGEVKANANTQVIVEEEAKTENVVAAKSHTAVAGVCTVCNAVLTDVAVVAHDTYTGLYKNAADTTDEAVYVIDKDSMFAFENLANTVTDFSGVTVKLAADIDLKNENWNPISQTGETVQFNGTFDGNGHTIKNLSIDSSAKEGASYSSGLFGFIDSPREVKIMNVTIDGATVTGHHNVAVIAGYSYAEITNCHVKNAKVTSTHANDDACGDKTGLIVGYNYNTVKDCTASESTITVDGRDAGQLIGASQEAYVNNCSATNVTVKAADTLTCTGANIRNEVIGRVL